MTRSKAMWAFSRCITLKTADPVYNAAKDRVWAYYTFLCDKEKGRLASLYYESEDHKKWIQDFRSPTVFPESVVADNDRYSGANLDWTVSSSPDDSDYCEAWKDFALVCKFDGYSDEEWEPVNPVIKGMIDALLQPSTFRLLERAICFIKDQIDASDAPKPTPDPVPVPVPKTQSEARAAEDRSA